MKLEGENVLLRVFLDTYQMWHHRPVYEVLVERARKTHMAGATAFMGLEGFGQDAVLLQEHPWNLSTDREVVVELVDTSEKIDGFLAEIEPMLKDAIVTRERVHVVRYLRRDEAKA
jgi:hypothetical protein